MNAPARFASQHRRSMLAKVHVAKKEMALDDDTYRAVIFRVTGHASSADCTDEQLTALLGEFRRLGWQAKPTLRRGSGQSASKAADHPTAKKARAMWISLGHLGAIKNPSEKALETFAARQTECAQMQWADQGKMFKLIEALKAMALRHGWDATGNDLKLTKRRLLDAILARLVEKGFAAESWSLAEAATRIAGFTPKYAAHQFWDLGDFDAVAGAFGRLLRDGQRGEAA